MKGDNFDKKEVLINEFINSGINITPSTLSFISTLDEPLINVKTIIKEVSFLPSFKGHLTLNVLKQISNKEINKALQRALLREEDSQSSQEGDNIKPINITISNSSNIKESEEKKKIKPKLATNLQLITRSSISQEKPLTIDSTSSGLPINKSVKRVKKSNFESSKTTLAFIPEAKEYEISFEILKDPTGKIYTSGSYTDFYDLTLDKFNRLRNLMKKRPEVLSANNINNILRLTNKVEISVIGIVKENRKTKKGNTLLILEDVTGLINILFRRDSENQDNIKIVETTLNDQVVYVEGVFNPGERGNSGIVYGSYISKIDIPRDYEPNNSFDPLSLALISDTHIGSKEFVEKLWYRFTDLLNGKIGNKKQRELAGKIKYVIINGDLVDGIGIYPGQKNDLIFSDIYDQFKEATKLLSIIPDYIKIIYSSGNHEPVRTAIPRPAVPKKYSEEIRNLGVSCVGNPAFVKTHNVNTLIYHGDSILDMNMLIPGLENNKPAEAMKELLKCRHLAPVYGKKTQIAPTNKDWLVIDKIPDIFHTGHIHINEMDYYNHIALVNSGCFQSQTDFMNSLGIQPTPGILSIIDLVTLKGTQLDLKTSI